MKLTCVIAIALGIGLPLSAVADVYADQAALENTLAQSIATYDPNLNAAAPADYENNLSISQSTEFASDDNFAIGAQLQVNTSTGSILQDGNDNVAGIFQVAGAGSTASVTQNGNSNFASVVQVGLGNVANVSQTSNNNSLVLNQQNGNNTANINQLGNSIVTINQTGNDVANLTFQVTSPTPVTYGFTQSPGSTWSARVTN